MEGELRSIRALILASMGRRSEAQAEIVNSESLSGHLEARCLRAFATAIVALIENDEAETLSRLQHALAVSSTTGNADSFVTSYRAVPDLLHLVARAETAADDFLLRPLVTYDSALGSKAGLAQRVPSLRVRDELTEREREVLALLRRGLSNRQIAQALWITESTAKVHVRHIFDKLGVRTRTAAALFSVELDS